MSVQFGTWNVDGNVADPGWTNQVRSILHRYGPDDERTYCRSGAEIVYCAFWATSESKEEIQPCVCGSGAVVTWDGRLDNREDLIHALDLAGSASDASIAAAAYERWGLHSFPKLIGDWA